MGRRDRQYPDTYDLAFNNDRPAASHILEWASCSGQSTRVERNQTTNGTNNKDGKVKSGIIRLDLISQFNFGPWD